MCIRDRKKEVYEVGGLSINDELKEVTVDGESVRLTPVSYTHLSFCFMNLILVSHPKKSIRIINY